MARPICFASDYGYADDFAGVCRGVIARIAPDVRVIDVTHGLPQRDVLAGALVLRNTLPYMPDSAVHLTVVDPGRRRARAGRSPCAAPATASSWARTTGCSRWPPSADGGVAEAYELTNEELWLAPLSATFHGRDIFAPVAARLAAGLPLDVVGPADRRRRASTRLELPELRRHRDGLTATAVLVDRFGNVALNLRARQLEAAKLGEHVELLCGGERFLARVARTFASRAPQRHRRPHRQLRPGRRRRQRRARRTRSSASSPATRCGCGGSRRRRRRLRDRPAHGARLASPAAIGYSSLSRVRMGRAFCHRTRVSA